MAPKIFTLLRCPVTGTSGGQPTRLQVACRVESWRKLASSANINAQFCRCVFFKAGISVPLRATLLVSVGWTQPATPALPAEAQTMEQHAHMSGVITNAEFLPD